jgi:hypothetical protein
MPGWDNASSRSPRAQLQRKTRLLVDCKLGPTAQNIGRATYRFELNGDGRAVCDVADEHAHVFLARPEVYEIAAIPSPTIGRGDAASLGKGGAAEPPSGGNTQRPKRGRPKGSGKDDSVALAELRALRSEGMGLNVAAKSVVARTAVGDATSKDSVRKRLLRKHKQGQSR